MERILIDAIIPLGKKIEKFQKKNTTYISDREAILLRDNLKFNLSQVIAKILLETEFPDRSPKKFNSLLNQYTTTEKVDLNLDFYLSRGWLRIICGEVLIPPIIHSYLWSLSRDEEHSQNLTQIEKLALDFLKIYQPFTSLDCIGTISKEKVEDIIKNYGHPELNLEYVKNNILIGEHSIDESKLCWNGYQNSHLHSLALRTEITAHLWFGFKSTYSPTISFNLLIQLIQKSNFWAADFKEYLSDIECKELFEIINNFLENEKDLENSNIEYRKCLFDSGFARNSRDIDITKPFLYKEITQNRASSIILEVQKSKFSFYQETIYDHTTLRSIYNYILELLSNDTEILRDSNLIFFLEKTKKPYLSYTTYNHILTKQSELIPQLIFIDANFAKLAFTAIIDLDIDENLLIYTENKLKEGWREIENDKKLEVKENLGIKLFEILTNSILLKVSNYSLNGERNYQGKIETLIEVLFLLSNQAYSKKYDSQKHNYLKEIYNNSVNYLEEIISVDNISILSDGIVFLSKKEIDLFQENKNFIHPNVGNLHLCLDLIKILEKLKLKEFLVDFLDNTIKKISHLIYNNLYLFYTIKTVEVEDYIDPTIKRILPVIHGLGDFAFESIDWCHLLLTLNRSSLIENLFNSFKTNLIFERNEDKYNDQNKNQKEKIILFLKSLLFAYKKLKTKSILDQFEKNTEILLETWIVELSTTYNKNDLELDRIDIFEFPFTIFSNNQYNQPLISLLFECVNLFEETSVNIFIEKFFKNNLNVNRALEAINKLKSKEAKVFISNHIKEINFDSFIDSVPTISEIQSTMINAVNSEENWILAKSLVDMVINHYNKMNYNKREILDLAAEVKLLLAFKEKDIDFIKKTITNSDNVLSKNIQRKALYFNALHLSYNEHLFEESEEIIRKLIYLEQNNIDYNFQLFRIYMLSPHKNNIERAKSYEIWMDFIKDIIGSNNEKNLKEIQSLIEYSENLSLIVLSLLEKYSLFDQIFNRLSSIYLYNEETMEVIFNTMQRRNLITNSLIFLTDAREYYYEQGINSNTLEKLEGKFPNLKTVTELQSVLAKLPSMKADIVPKILPVSETNNITDLYLFICYQLILSMSVVKEKFKAIRLENEYNDFVLALLRLRISLWGWSIEDQQRMGRSANGKDAGEIDILIRSGGKTITLIEALRLSGRDQDYVKLHAEKTQFYNSQINNYYILIYYIGSKSNYENTWNCYCEDFFSSNFDSKCIPNKNRGFENLSDMFIDTRDMKIAKTFHGPSDKITYFHIMLNLSKI